MFPYIDDENPTSGGGEEQPPSSSSSSFLHFSAAFLDDHELLHTHLLPPRQLILEDRSGGDGEDEGGGEINAAVAAAAASNMTTSTADKEETSSDVAVDHHQQQQQQQQQKKPLEVAPPSPPPMKKKSDKKSVPRKRTGKKDRHSKIYTAQGPRDRRMRLSLQIARKFFDLQDMLGFDKASKTIEWLFTKSKAAIKELTGNLPQIKHIAGGGGGGGGGTTASSSSNSVTKEASKFKEIAHHNGESSTTTTTPKEKKNRKPRISSKSAAALLNPVAKESREKARARARERTREKMIMRSLEKSKQCCPEPNPNNLEHQQLVVPSRPVETAGEASGSRSREMSASLEMEEHSTHSLEHQMATVGIIEKFLGIPSSSTSSSIFNYSPNNNFPCFPGNWEIENSRIHSGYSAMPMTNMGQSTGNFHQDQNPTSVFMTTTNDHVRQVLQNPTSSIFITASNLRVLESQFQHHQNSCNDPLDGNRNHRLC